jgi:hypothetical protein
MHEHALAAATSATLLGVSLLGLRFPRLLAWPLAAVGALFGGLGVVRATRSASIEYSSYYSRIAPQGAAGRRTEGAAA